MDKLKDEIFSISQTNSEKFIESAKHLEAKDVEIVSRDTKIDLLRNELTGHDKMIEHANEELKLNDQKVEALVYKVEELNQHLRNREGEIKNHKTHIEMLIRGNEIREVNVRVFVNK